MAENNNETDKIEEIVCEFCEFISAFMKSDRVQQSDQVSLEENGPRHMFIRIFICLGAEKPNSSVTRCKAPVQMFCILDNSQISTKAYQRGGCLSQGSVGST